MKARFVCALSIVCLAVAQGAAAQANGPPSCDSPEHRQFDFWVGSWEVVDTAGKVLGHNRITRALNDCVIREEWTSAGGMKGESFNIYRRATGTWHQTWVDGAGTLLLLDGALDGASMVLTGATGDGVEHRISYTPLDDGTVRQVWEMSRDKGATWSVSFHGIYRRQP